MRLALALCLLVGCGGGKKAADQAPPVRSGDDADKLWALAPPGIAAGVVITPHGVTELDRGFERVRKIVATSAELAPIRGQLDAAITTVLGSPQGHLADAGIAADRGFAMFMVADDALLIAPVVDRKKFVAALHGESKGDVDVVRGITCKQLAAGYACAKAPALFDQLGKGGLGGKLAAAGARGDIEVYVAAKLLGSGVQEVFATAALDDGLLDAHAFIAAKLPAKLSAIAGVAAAPPDDKGAGFVLANFAPGLAEIPSSSPLGAIAKTIKGPLAATMASGELAFQARVPLTDGAPMQGFLEHCDQLGAMFQMPATAANGACHLTVPHALVPLGFDLWVESGELRLGSKKGAFSPGTSDTRTAIGRELASGAWQYALWGRGTIFATHVSSALGTIVDPTVLAQLPIVLRVLAQLSELGLGVKIDADGVRARAYGRTVWANPTDVAEQVAAIPAAELMSGKGDQTAADIAAAHRDAPFAGDLAAGPSGMMAPVAVVGMLAAVAIPAFMDYMKKSKVTEAALQLNKLGKNAKVYYITNAEFPKGTAALTPAASCCGGPRNHCVTTPADWASPVWQALDFQIDEPSLFQYSYTGDGATFTATAVGDLDCDGTMITYTLTGTADQGNPRMQLTEPPPNSD